MAWVVAGLLTGCAVPRAGRVLPTTEVPTAGSPEFPQFLASWFQAPLHPASHLEELANGDAFLPAMLGAIREARADVRLEMYIFWSDSTGREFLEALRDRADHGVRVQILLDWLGCRRMFDKEVDRLRAAGAEVRFFHRGFIQTPAKLNHRDHRKFLLVDGRVGFTGGAGIARMWEGEGDERRRWRDSMFRFEGPAVKAMEHLFDAQWVRVGGVRTPQPATPAQAASPSPPEDAGAGYSVQLLTDGGGDRRDPIYESYLLALRAARKSVRLGMAYFVPNARLCAALEEARRRGVRVEVIVPGGYMDSWPVTPASRKRWGRLLRAGVRIHEFQPAMYHAKVLVVDDVWVCAGSANWDNRSLRLNEEANFHVQSESFAAAAIRQFEHDKQLSDEVTLEHWRRRSLLKRLTEVLIWPLEPLL